MSRVFTPTIDGLERRSLMAARPLAALVSIQVSPTGRIAKVPAFSAEYLGVPRPNLNLANASAMLRPGRTLSLSATVAARIAASPRDPSMSSFFVFGLDRRSPQSLALFPTRPGIRFDSVVVARITPKGISGYVLDIARGNIETEINPAWVRVRGRTATVTIPDGILAPPRGFGAEGPDAIRGLGPQQARPPPRRH